MEEQGDETRGDYVARPRNCKHRSCCFEANRVSRIHERSLNAIFGPRPLGSRKKRRANVSFPCIERERLEIWVARLFRKEFPFGEGNWRSLREGFLFSIRWWGRIETTSFFRERQRRFSSLNRWQEVRQRTVTPHSHTLHFHFFRFPRPATTILACRYIKGLKTGPNMDSIHFESGRRPRRKKPRFSIKIQRFLSAIRDSSLFSKVDVNFDQLEIGGNADGRCKLARNRIIFHRGNFYVERSIRTFHRHLTPSGTRIIIQNCPKTV